MKKILLIFISLFTIFLLSGCDNDLDFNNNTGFNEPAVKKYNVKIHIDFPSNIIFSRYDVKMEFNGKSKTLSHGEGGEFDYSVKEGEYVLSFSKAEDGSNKNEQKIKVDSDMEVGYTITCQSDGITVTSLYTDRKVELNENQIKIDFDKSKFNSYSNYKTIVEELKGYGFTNIEEKPLYDIIFGITKEGEPGSVIIDGKEDYKRGNVYNKDVKIIVEYHMNYEKDPDRIKPPYDYTTAKEIKYQVVEQAFKDAGFTNVKTESKTINNDDYDELVYDILIDDSTADASKTYQKDSKVLIKYNIYKKTETKKTDEYGDSKHKDQAKRAFEKMGDSLYPYGIKYHWFVGLRDFTYKGNGVWHIEVEVTITNKYKAKRDAIAEANVDFKKEKVKDWKVYNK